MSSQQATNAPKVDMKLEVVVVPVSDVDRAKRFYEKMGWRVDADFAAGDSWRIVQVTPPGSACSFFLGKGITKATPGSVQGLLLTVENVDTARAELVGYGVEASEVFHFDGNRIHFTGSQGRLSGPDPERQSYFSFVSFNDPDGNGWVLQEITTRFPGRGISSEDVGSLIPLLRETEELHGKYEATAPKHHWSEWYAPYIVARERGRTSKDAFDDAVAHVAERSR